MNDLFSFYSSKAEQYSIEIQRIKKQLFYTAVSRLFTFILLVGLIYTSFKSDRSSLYIFLSFIALVAFLLRVKKSNALTEDRKLYENLHFINENELNILKGQPNKFDNGSSALSNNNYFADLDVFGERSLFHLLNRTSTKEGFNSLVSLLKKPFTSTSKINDYQQAIKSYAPQTELREKVIAKALLNKEATGNINKIYSWLEQPVVLLRNKWILMVRVALPVINLILIIICLNLDNYYPLTIAAIIGWLHVGYFSKYIQQQHILVGRKQHMLDQYADILKEFEKVDAGTSEVLKQTKQLAAEAHHEIKKLSQLTNLLDQRMNLVVNLLLNSFIVYDIQCMVSLEKWKVKNREHLSKWIECVATIETLTSLSAFAYNHPAYCYPEVLTSGLAIEATELGHPLISKEESVTNNISIGSNSKLLLITGSNMSGKTTFLRTVGINTLLAQCGAPVCATTYAFTPVDIYTSIRISDSLQEHTSYFMAELKRLSEIKDSLANGAPSLVLIDEILRGTNSEDKYYGSAEFVKKLVEYNCLTLFATHDLKLSELEYQYPGQIENYCFESIIEGDDLKFDYQILKGVAQNKNASFLMKKMKII